MGLIEWLFLMLWNIDSIENDDSQFKITTIIRMRMNINIIILYVRHINHIFQIYI